MHADAAHTRGSSFLAAHRTGGSVASLSFDGSGRGQRKERKKVVARSASASARPRDRPIAGGSLLLGLSRPTPARAAQRPRSTYVPCTRDGRVRRHAPRRRERGNGNGMTPLHACVRDRGSKDRKCVPLIPWLVGRRGSRDPLAHAHGLKLVCRAFGRAAVLDYWWWVNERMNAFSHACERDTDAVRIFFFHVRLAA